MLLKLTLVAVLISSIIYIINRGLEAFNKVAKKLEGFRVDTHTEKKEEKKEEK
jgi:hypothetical protein